METKSLDIEETYSGLGDPSREVVPDPGAVNLLLQVLLKAGKLRASDISLVLSGKKLIVDFVKRSPQGERSSLGSLTAERLAGARIYRALSDRLFYWPDPGDPTFASAETKKKRLLVAPKGSLRLCGDVGIGGKGSSPSIQISNIVYDVVPLVDSIFLSPTNARYMSAALSAKCGIIVANKVLGQHVIDGAAVILASRPDALIYPASVTKNLLRDAVEKAQKHLVVILCDTADPVAMFLAMSGLTKDDSELLEAFLRCLHLCFVHRQIRRICSKCARPVRITPETVRDLPKPLMLPSNMNYMFGRGCSECGQSAYRGSVGIQSLLPVDEQIRKIVRDKPTDFQLTELAYRRGMRSLLEDGLKKIEDGLTSFEEVTGACGQLSSSFEAAIISHATAGRETLVDVKLEQALGSLGDDFFVASAKEHNGSLCLLVVEDDGDQREVLEILFQNQGYKVLGAKNGRDALDLLGREKVDLVICDIMMPEMSGVELLRRIRTSKNLGAIPVLMLTAISDSEAEYKLLDQGADDYCDKHTSKKVLLKRVERLLKAKRSNPLAHLLDDA